MRFYLLIFIFLSVHASAQTGLGIGIYPTGTETGLGYRSAKDTRWAADVRITRANLSSEKNKVSSFVTEVSSICRVIKLEKVRFHIGVGYKADWNFHEKHKHGITIPTGIEAFPFPFQNAGLFFEAAPFYITDFNTNNQAGIRTVAGFVFYFPVKTKTTSPL